MEQDGKDKRFGKFGGKGRFDGKGPFGPKKFGGKKFGGKKFGGGKFGDEKTGDEKFAGKKFGGAKRFGEKKFSDRKFGDKPFGPKKFGGKFAAKKSSGQDDAGEGELSDGHERSFIAKKEFGGYGDRKPFGGKKFGGSKRFGEKKFSDRKFGDRKFGDKPFAAKKFGGKKFGGKKFFNAEAGGQAESFEESGEAGQQDFGVKKEFRSYGDRKPFGGKKFGDRKFGDRKFGNRKFGDRKPYAGKRFGDAAPLASGQSEQVDESSQEQTRSFAPKKEYGSYGGRKPSGGGRFAARKFGDKPFAPKKFGDRKFGDRKFGDKKFGGGFGRKADEYQPRAQEPQLESQGDEYQENQQEPDGREIRQARPVEAVQIPSDVARVYLRSVSYGAFIYDKMVGRVEGHPADGDLVAVIDKRGDFFGWGFYNSHSLIALRMFSHDNTRPTDSLIASRIRQAVLLRRNLLRLEDKTDAYRLLHAEGDGLSGLIADRFGKYVVIELFSMAMFRRLNVIQDAIVDSGLDVKQFIVRADKGVCQQEGFSLSEIKNPRDCRQVIVENGVKFDVDLAGGHKTGFFCDQRDNRLALASLTPGKTMLDVCCYTGGFSCYAGSLGRASSVTSVDLDENALVLANRNASLNDAKVEFVHRDGFDYLREADEAKRQWEVVVVDPSKFVPRRADMEAGLRKYFDLNQLAATVVAPGGVMLTCSCSGLVDQRTFIQTISRSLRAAGRSGKIFRVSGAADDHPIMPDTPESAYLKAVWLRLD